MLYKAQNAVLEDCIAPYFKVENALNLSTVF